MTLEERAIEKGEKKGRMEGEIKVLKRMGKSDDEIIQDLVTMKNVTKEQAGEALENYKSSNGIKG